MSHPLERLGAWLLIILIGFSCFFSFREALVSVLWQGVHSNVRLWMSGVGVDKPGTWEQVRDFTETALRWDAKDPQLLQTAGAMYWWGGWISRDSPELSEQRANRGLDFYRSAIERRPAWPEAWLYLAYAKHRQGDWDDEFQYAFEMAWENGAWREPVIFKTSELGFEAWQKLTHQNRQRFFTALERAALRDTPRLQRLADNKQATFVLCLAMHKQRAIGDYCRQRGYRLSGG